MMNNIEFVNRQRKIAVTDELKQMLIKCIKAALRGENISHPVSVDVTFVSDRTIRSINKEHRGKDAATDVLSFPMLEFLNGSVEGELSDYEDEDGTVFLGDIIISLERAQAQSEEYGHSFMRETGFLCVHSMLHLLGYDHEEDEESRKTMRIKEEAALESIGLAR